MKLRAKLALATTAIIIIAVGVCCILILRFAQDRALAAVATSALTDMENFCREFSSDTGDIPHDETVKRSYSLDNFRRISGSWEYALRYGSDYLFNNAGFDIEDILQSNYLQSTDYGLRYRTVRIYGVNYFIVGGKASLGANIYNIALVRNISADMKSIEMLGLQCLAVAIVITAVAVILMWVIVFRAMKPIEKLRAVASELAQGRYENRIRIVGRDELSELASDFNSMADAIEQKIIDLHEKTERQQTFINDLSHELKTPVTSILLCSETLLKRKISSEVLTRSLERIYDQGKWLDRLSQKLMALVILRGEIPLRQESVAELMEVVRTSTIDALQEAEIELKTECDMDILLMDFDLMRSALVNLVENARKASEAGQQIKLFAHDNMIEVIDQGVGIPREEVPRITEPFYMVDRSRNKKIGGSGLGLALVKQIAEAHGAQFTIESFMGQGTTIRLIFKSP